MKKKIVFMLQNGIGFGHFKLALTISKYLNNNAEISFITQAKSTEIFNNYNYKVYNFPMLYTLKSNNEILIMNKLLNKLIENIKPDVIIEDTYPEDFYLNLPALLNVSKILILNRLSSSEFENYYYNGVLNQYEKLIVLKDKECFLNDITSREVRNFVNYSEKIKYLSGVFNEPSKEVKDEIIKKYNIDKYDKNIVVNCGAGGWHIGNNICDEIFKKAIIMTNKLVKKGLNVQTILVLGPYSKYLEEHLQSYIINDNIKIVDFETNLDALFQVVDLCILRPGYNSTMESLSGRENILLLPGISYMEDQLQWCEELKRVYGVDYLDVNKLDNFDNKVIKLLKTNIRTKEKVQNNTQKVAEEIYSTIVNKLKPMTIRLAFNNLSNEQQNSKKYKDYNIDFLNKKDSVVFLNKIPVINMEDFNYKNYSKYDKLIIYNDQSFTLERIEYYDKRYHITSNGYIVVEYEEIIYNSYEEMLKQINTILRNTQKFNPNIIIKLPPIENEIIEKEIINPLLKYFNENNIEIENLDAYLNEKVNEKIANYKFGYYRPEITKLN